MSDIMRMNGMNPSGFPIQIHEDINIGLTMDAPDVREISDGLGGKCFVAVAQIGSIFGSEVDGELRGIGRTREIAIERLKQEQKNLADSLWA